MDTSVGQRRGDGRGNPCERAGSIAQRNGATVRTCQVADWDVVVRVVTEGVRLPGGALELEARGRAGPVTD